MKKWIIGLMVVCLAAVVLVALNGNTLFDMPAQQPQEQAQSAETPENPAPAETETPAEAETAAPAEDLPAQSPEEPAAEEKTVDYDAIYALHAPDEVVMTVDGKPVTWQDYFYAYFSQAANMEQQFEKYQYYGMALGWESQADEEGHTFADLVPQLAEQNLRRVITAESVAEEKNIRMLPDEEAEIQAAHQENIEYFCGEDGTEEELLQQLWEQRYLTEDFYWRVLRFGPLTEATRRTLYGNDGMRLNDKQVEEWMNLSGILSANHILIPTVALSTGEALDEATVAEKTELAKQIAAELQAIEDPAAREARFLELKELHDADGGAYVFGPGVMVQEFYDGTLALEPGQVSDPVQSSYGFHVILRRAIHADDVVTTSEGSAAARSMMADELFSQMMSERMEAQVVEYADGFETPSILDYVIRAEA